MFDRLFKRNPTRDFHEIGRVPLEFNTSSVKLNGVSMGAAPLECSVFGRASRYISVVKTHTRLEYRDSGLILEFNNNRLEYMGFIIASPNEHTDDTLFQCAQPTIVPGSFPLTSKTLESECEQFLNTTSYRRDEDEDECVVTYKIGKLSYELEFLPKNGALKTFAIFES